MTITNVSDPLWPEFAALWARVSALEPPPLLSGGYGLFLKQWFLTQSSGQTTVPLERWRGVPRSTRDFDLLLDVQLIAQPEEQREIRAALDTLGYTARTPHWQFGKTTAGGQEVLVDLLAPVPEKGVPGVKVEGRRVKSDPSFGAEGVHGNPIAEAIGCNLFPLGFEWQGVVLRVPNSVSWCVMKLHATRDRWQKSQSGDDAADRDREREQMLKHAGDVLRLVALSTREEREANRKVSDSLRSEAAFAEAADIARAYFLNPRATLRGEPKLVGAWETRDFETICTALASWFGA